MKVLLRNRIADPSVQCSPADRSPSCGNMIPFRIRTECPACGALQDRAYAPNPPADALIVEGDAILIDADTEAITAVHSLSMSSVADDLLRQLNSVRHWEGGSTRSARLSGIHSAVRHFGYTPPQPLRSRWACQQSSFDREHPACADMLRTVFEIADNMLEQHAPHAYELTHGNVENEIAAMWRIGSTAWTSGVINKTAALPYHRDANNIQKTWSAMFAVREDMEGGLLHLVDYDVWLAIPHGSVSLFDGQSVLHGVSPMKAGSVNARRYTMVAYARTAMRKCCPDGHSEARRAALAATQADERKAAKARIK